ncbi:hypothetical protein ABTX85_25540 [Streptomyces sp. NPDC096097]|uniref:hypothetical protein n=1 Tax=Streptomyces sp. NPDC096097 TaxID=3155546 RepID=UPI00331FAC67
MSVGAMGVFGRRLLFAVDARGYGSADTARQRDIQTVLPRLLSDAAEAAGLDRASWVRQAGGDSEFAVLPAGSGEQALVEPFMRRLDAGLRAYNRDRVPAARLALRAAVHFGPASEAPNGFVGPGPVEVSRILESDPLRRALAAAPDATLAVALTAPIFTEIVAQGYTNFRPEEFREVVVAKKEYRGRAWLWVAGCDVHTLDLGDSDSDSDSGSGSGSGLEPDSPSGSGPGSGTASGSTYAPNSGSASDSDSGSTPSGAGGGDSVTNNLYGTTIRGNVVFGISK